jgi:hypothetical protein
LSRGFFSGERVLLCPRLEAFEPLAQGQDNEEGV